MAGITTTYDIMVKLGVKNRLGKPLKEANTGMRRLSEGAARANKRMSSLAKAAAAVGVGFLAGKGLKTLIDVNAELEKTQAGLRTIIQMNTGSSFANSNVLATGLMEKFRKDAATSAGTFQDMAKFAGAIAAPVTQMGGSLEDLREITKGAVVAAAAFGERSDVAQLDITQALAGTLGAKDRFAKQLGIDPKSFNKLLPKDRLKLLKETLGQKAIKDAAKSYQTSFAGVTSTFKSNLEQAAERIGKPLFLAISKQLQTLNKWFDNNQAKIRAVADRVAQGLVKAFEFAKRTFGFISEHKDLLMALATAFLAGKVGGAIAQPFVQFGSLLGQAGGAVSAFGKAAGAAIASFGAGYAAGKFVDKKLGLSDKLSDLWVEAMTGTSINREAEDKATQDYLRRQRLAKEARAAVTVGMHGPYDQPSLGRQAPNSTGSSTSKNHGGRQIINIKMDVASDDPDRFAISLEDYFNTAATNPSQASNAWRK